MVYVDRFKRASTFFTPAVAPSSPSTDLPHPMFALLRRVTGWDRLSVVDQFPSPPFFSCQEWGRLAPPCYFFVIVFLGVAPLRGSTYLFLLWGLCLFFSPYTGMLYCASLSMIFFFFLCALAHFFLFSWFSQMWGFIEVWSSCCYYPSIFAYDVYLLSCSYITVNYFINSSFGNYLISLRREIPRVVLASQPAGFIVNYRE